MSHTTQSVVGTDEQGPVAPARTTLDRYFKITERGSTVGRELRGGLVTFVTMAYIVILNPLIIGGVTADTAATDVAGGWLPAAQVGAVTGLTAGVPDEMAAPLTRDAAFPKRMGRPEEYARLC